MLKRPSSNCASEHFVSLRRWIDDQNLSSSPDLTIEANGDQIDVVMKPSLPSGRHVLRCIVTNPSRSRRTLLERVFDVHSNLPGSFAHPLSATSHVTLARRMLQESDVVTSYALEYPLAGRTRLLMQTDWSHVMLLLNPLILSIIVLCYWGCRTIGLSILRKHAGGFTPSSAWFFVSDRPAKYAVFKQFFGALPLWLAVFFSRLLLFTSDNLVFYGVLASLLLHLLLPAFFRDARVLLRLLRHA